VFTDAQGRASVNYDPRQWQVANVIVTPQAGLWSWWAASPASGGVLTLPDLPLNAQLGWWHQLLGITAYRENAGQGIRIGLADTGAGPHQNLPHLQSAGAFIDGGHDASAAASNDVSDHGTHVAGIVAAHPAGNGYAGIAPGADVVAARVYRDAGAAASNADVAAALDAFATEHRCDLINLSLGGSQSSAIELDAVTAAAEKGSLVLAAAGNTAGAIDYPAAYPGVVAVSAVGLYGTFPMNAIEALALPASADKFVGSLFEASFNNSGPHMACTAPGVGIISTVPGDGYASMSGTSMACPVVTAALATLLAADANYVRLPRDVSRARYAWNVLLRSLRSLGLNSTYQGLGLVTGSAT
jgi:subtilisin family serine protease